MNLRHSLFLLALVLPSCDWMPGKPDPSKRWQPPSAISDFTVLYQKNCVACHSLGEFRSPAIAMNDPLYLSVLPEETLREVIRNGVPGTTMPAFSQPAGGVLTDAQIDILVKGILAARPSTPAVEPLPAYSAPLGSMASGAEVYSLACASCHGADGRGGTAGALTAPGFINLVSNQYLRTITIAGRPELGCPDFTKRIPGRAMTESEIADVTAWLASNRVNEFGERIQP